MQSELAASIFQHICLTKKSISSPDFVPHAPKKSDLCVTV